MERMPSAIMAATDTAATEIGRNRYEGDSEDVIPSIVATDIKITLATVMNRILGGRRPALFDDERPAPCGSDHSRPSRMTPSFDSSFSPGVTRR